MATIHSGVAQAFRRAACSEFSCFFVEEGNVIFRISAAAHEVGDLTITDDGDRLTCTIGKIDHQHFEVECPPDGDLKQGENLAAEHVVQWVSDVIRNKVQFRIQKHRGRVICSGAWYPEEGSAALLSVTDEWFDYRWSGLVSHSKSM